MYVHPTCVYRLKIYRINGWGFKETTILDRCDLPKSFKKQGWKLA